jgi:hypothetical protein
MRLEDRGGGSLVFALVWLATELAGDGARSKPASSRTALIR